jgi:hypothetical protein
MTLKILSALAACAAAFLAGCDSGVEDTVRSALAPRQAPRTRVFAGDPKAVYEAARAAADSMGYRYIRGGPAQGELEELSGISTGDTAGSSRQISMRVHLVSDVDGSTSVSVSFGEILEGDSANQPGIATETPMRDTPLYEVFFDKVQALLLAPAKSP